MVKNNAFNIINFFYYFRKIIFEKQWFYLDNAIGHVYGTAFEVTGGGNLQPKQEVEEINKGIAKDWLMFEKKKNNQQMNSS